MSINLESFDILFGVRLKVGLKKSFGVILVTAVHRSYDKVVFSNWVFSVFWLEIRGSHMNTLTK